MLARYIAQRIWQLIPVLILVSMAVFLIVRIIPGDPVLVMMGIDAEERARISDEQYRALQQQLGFDRPIYVQYFNWLTESSKAIWACRCARAGRFSRSSSNAIRRRFIWRSTALLTGLAIAIPAGCHRGDPAEHQRRLRRHGLCPVGHRHAQLLARA